MDMLSGLITSKIRIQILMRLFLNPDRNAYLRELSNEFGASPSHIKSELAQLKAAELLTSAKRGRQVLFSANRHHPVFNELQSMVQKALGMDRILDSIINRLGNLEKAFLIDDYAKGKDSGIIDLVLVGNIDLNHLNDLTRKTERYIKRKIRTLVLLNETEFKSFEGGLKKRGIMLLWERSQNGG
jgi:DNA-binding transcriptional ArsR family regulator